MTPIAFRRRRAGFTLVELLTVMFIIAVLAAISVAVARSSIADSYTTTGASDRLSGWLLIAKNRALRDKVPVGLRLIRDPNNPNVAREAQYVEMPTLWAPNLNPDGHALRTTTPTPPFLVVRYETTQNGYRQEDGVQSVASNFGVFVFGIDPRAFDVNEGDLLRIADFGSSHRIEAISPPITTPPIWYPTNTPGNLYPPVTPSFPGFKLTLAQSMIPLRANEQFPPSPPNPPMLLPFPQAPYNQNPPAAGYQTATYPANYPPLAGDNYYRTFFFGFFRSARPILGEPLVSLPAGMVVDMTPDRLVGGGQYPRYVNPSMGLPELERFRDLNALPAAAGVPVLRDIDILFAPTGQVMFTDSGLVCFWLRNETKPAPAVRATLGGTPLLESQPMPVNGPPYTTRFFDRSRMLAGGESLIVSVYTKTGSIGTYPVFMPDPANQYNQILREDMYKFVRDAFNRGL